MQSEHTIGLLPRSGTVLRETLGVAYSDPSSSPTDAQRCTSTVRAALAAVESDLVRVSAGAARDADVNVEYLGEYLPGVIAVCRAEGRVDRFLLDATRAMGGSAAEGGVPPGALVDLYLSATWRLWSLLAEHLEGAAAAAVASLATVVMRAADDTVAVLSEGYESAQRSAVRREESLRREFVDDLLSGGSDPGLLAERAARFGFNIAGEHVILVGRAHHLLEDAGPVHGRVEALVLAELGGRDVLVATKDGVLVCAFPPEADLVDRLVHMLRDSGDGPWRIGVGDAHGGPGGLLRSYQEALSAIELTGHAALPDEVAYFNELLPLRLLASDPSIAGSLVHKVLGPLDRARDGAEPLIETLAAYFETGGNLVATARRLHLSPRAVRYRLDRITTLTGRSPFEPDDRFTLELALRCHTLLSPSSSLGRHTYG